MNTPRFIAVLVLIACSGAACEREVRVVKYNPFLGGLPGAESGMPVVRNLGDYADPTAIPLDQLVRESEPGKKTFVAKSGRHLMIHIYNTLKDNDKELFVREVLSSITKTECFEQAVDPGEAFDYLKAREEDVRALFDLMPSGEQTPGVFMQPVGKNIYRVQVSGLGTSDLAWTGFDMVMEKGNWKLRWFVK